MDSWLCYCLINKVPPRDVCFQGSNICTTTNIYSAASSYRRDPSMLPGYLEWWNWRVQVYLARLVTWRLGPVVHRRKSARRPPGESGGRWACTPAGGYIAQLLRGECGAGRPAGTTTKQARRKQVVWLGLVSLLTRSKSEQLNLSLPSKLEQTCGLG